MLANIYPSDGGVVVAHEGIPLTLKPVALEEVVNW